MNSLILSGSASILLVALIAAGCGRKNRVAPPAETASPEAVAADSSNPAETPGRNESAAPHSGAPQRNPDKDLQRLNQIVHDYVLWKKVIPKDLNEVVASGLIKSLPAPPAGKRFVVALRPLGYRVELVDAE